MKKIFKVEAICHNKDFNYAVYQKRFFGGWKFIKSYYFKSDAIKLAEMLAEQPIYFETKDN